MRIVSVRTGRTVKVVTIDEVPEVDDSAVKDFACAAAGETWRGEGRSLFDTHVTYFTDDETDVMSAVVDLYTD